MHLVEELMAEHALIDTMLGSLRCFVQARIRDGVGTADAQDFVDFFRLYAGHFHHAREEDVFLAALVREAGLPIDHGPIAVIRAEHRELAVLLDALAPLLCTERLEAEEKSSLHDLARRYSHGLWHHIDAENSVIFPEGEDRLRRSSVRELQARPASAEELDARARAQELVKRYPPLEDPEVFRGEGCALCPAYGVRCDGLEREWWTDTEWEELDERARQMD